MPEPVEPTTEEAPPAIVPLVEPPEPAAAAPAEEEGVDDDDYNDILFEALKKVYDEMGDDDPAVVVTTPAVDGGTPDKRSVDEMGVTELRAALKQTNTTLREVVKATLADREESHAIDVWNNFLDQADPIEREIAKAAPFEVEDAEGMKKQITVIKAQAAAAKRVIEAETGIKVQQQVGQLRRDYGIMTPDPAQVGPTLSEQDAKDMAEGHRDKVIARRFAKMRGR